MSVLNQNGEEQVECPLCMEPLEVDDLNFFPCTCGYQICRFCWHRIRTDENGLCPACRKAYSENPADFIPLSKEQVAQLKVEKRQRDQQRKAKLSESRKHLASVRVVQRNLVFVVGLPIRLADPEVLKKHEYFGKFGKIHKVVINQSTAYAGTQGPSASAYVTYMKSDDALRAIQSVNNITIDGRTIKSSLGTTKYCSHFMKNQPCPKPDCMYLHDFGDQEASFTKEQMHAGKHQEYEKKLHDALIAKMAAQVTANNGSTPPEISKEIKSQPPCSNTAAAAKQPAKEATTNGTAGTNKENWPQLNPDKIEKKTTDKTEKDKQKSGKKTKNNNNNNVDKKVEKRNSENSCQSSKSPTMMLLDESKLSIDPICAKLKETVERVVAKNHHKLELLDSHILENMKLPPMMDDNSSFFSANSFTKLPESSNDDHHRENPNMHEPFLDMNNTDRWEFDFGYTKHSNHLEELAKQRSHVKDTLDTFGNNFGPLGGGGGGGGSQQQQQQQQQQQDIFNKTPFGHLDSYSNTENLLESLAKKSVNYNMQYKQQELNQQYIPQLHKELSSTNSNGLDQHMSKFLTDFYKNGFNNYQGAGQSNNPGMMHLREQMSSHMQTQQTQSQMSFGQNMRELNMREALSQNPTLGLNGLSQNINININGLNQPSSNGYFNTMAEKQKTLLLLQQQRQLEEQLMNLSMAGVPPPHSAMMNGHYDSSPGMLGGAHYGAQNMFGNAPPSQGKSRPILEDKELDFRFQEAQKALEELVESDNHMHNAGRTNLVTNQLNGFTNSSNHLPPPPPGFVQQQNTHMNSFGSKILPYLNMNSQQQQMSSTQNIQNNWPSSFSQLQQNHQQQQSQQQQHKGMGVCNDWKILDPAILSSRRHIPNMPPLIDQYSSPLQQHLGGVGQQAQTQLQNGASQQQRAPQQQQQQQQQQFDTFNNGFSNYNPLQQQTFNNYSHLTTQQNLNWLGNELNTQISSPPGFRTPTQATKQQEC